MSWSDYGGVVIGMTLMALTQFLPVENVESDLWAGVSAFVGAVAWQAMLWEKRGWKLSLIFGEIVLGIVSGLGLHAIFLAREEPPTMREILFWCCVAGYVGALVWEQLAAPMAEAMSRRIKEALAVIFGGSNKQ